MMKCRRRNSVLFKNQTSIFCCIYNQSDILTDDDLFTFVQKLKKIIIIIIIKIKDKVYYYYFIRC